ncbi:hypothetical protein L3X38_037241 [Prunus dulcis]|uniref:Uncharacterized protein n=1 Tax=Prunus dulcis TaxID=3755 RepID=A0AAD4V303_PRUDU|nr:hypothetical protein L3X38_037241 [Prunus dulcis]
METTLQNQAASIRNLEVQMGQLAKALTIQERGVLPSQSEVNLKIQEHVKAITLRNGRPIKTTIDLDAEKQQQQLKTTGKAYENSLSAVGPPQLATASSTRNLAKTEQPPPTNLIPKSHISPIPFPQRLKKNKKDAHFSNFLKFSRNCKLLFHLANH